MICVILAHETRPSLANSAMDSTSPESSIFRNLREGQEARDAQDLLRRGSRMRLEQVALGHSAFLSSQHRLRIRVEPVRLRPHPDLQALCRRKGRCGRVSRMADDEITQLGRGRFSVLRPMGTPGTEARVFLCRDSLLTDEAVCRVATGENPSDAFRMQFELLVKISSPTLVRPLGLFLDEDLNKPFIELEHIAGAALSDWSVSATLTDRLRAFSTVAETVALLHRAHVVHGDVHPGNVLVANDRFVLIDPDAAAWGSVMRHAQGPSERSIDTDRRGLVAVFSHLFNIQEQTLRLRPLVNVVNSSSSVSVIADAARQLLARTDLQPVDWSRVKAIGTWQGDSIKSRREQFVRYAHARAIAFDVLHQYIARAVEEAVAAGAQFSLDGLSNSSTQLDQELATADTPLSSLQERRFRIATPERDQWHIILNSYPEFRRPWPTIEGRPRSTVDFAHSQLHVAGETRVNEEVELRFSRNGDGTMEFMHFDGAAWRPIDAEWITRCLRVLSGAVLPVLQRPEAVSVPKKDKASWPVAAFEYAVEDAPHMRYTDRAIDWLVHEIHAWLRSQRRSGPDDTADVRLMDALELPDKKAIEFLRELYRRHFLEKFGMYLDAVEAFDVVLDPERRGFTLNVRLTAHDYGSLNLVYPVEEHRAPR